ncbi:hypothetical protein AVEN_109688-1 [Araneus ventricosus]|uniref:Uncharacterized protein n=1 Tax=Araneus ventricosus TaxID=182803 RepID=A0A4Y2MF10_ARAVE|nr:hypothetical protein AVEN_109688-1 [Araneus ventricosus]
MADKIIELSPGALNSVSDSAFASCHVSQRDEQLFKMQKQIDELYRLVISGSRHTSPTQHRNRSPSRTGAQKREDWQCWYHFSFKEKAEHCVPPCAFKQKNSHSPAVAATASVLRDGHPQALYRPFSFTLENESLI